MERFPFTEELWAAAAEAPDYFASLANYRNLVLSLHRTAEDVAAAVADGERAPLDAFGAGGGRVLVLTADWCGDSAMVLPFVARLTERAGVPLRIIRYTEATDANAWLNAHGWDHIPAVVGVRPDGDAWDAAFFWMERPAAAHAVFDAWKAEHPRFMELYPQRESSDEARKEYAGLYAKMLRDISKRYREGLWMSVAEELLREAQRVERV